MRAWVRTSVRRSPIAIGDRAEEQRAGGAGEEHQEEHAVARLLGMAVRGDPQRDEGEQREPDDAAKGDHAAEERHGAPASSRPRRASLGGAGASAAKCGVSTRVSASADREDGNHREKRADEPDAKHEQAGHERAERIAHVAADVEVGHPARPLRAARVRGELRALGMKRGDAEAAGEDEQQDERIDGETAAGPTPTAARIVPPGMSQSAPERSDQSPNRGCTSDDEIVEARSSMAASA